PGLPAPDGPVEREPFRSLRNKVAVKMTTSSILMPHVAHMDDIDVTDIEALRREYNLRQADKGEPGADAPGKLTLLAFVMKAVAAGLKDYPMFNASVDLASREIVYKKYYNIGFAADTPRGLMVPVVHDADRQSLAGAGYRIRHLAGLARNGDISVPELTGGTFTITNVGAIGGTHVFPIINAPESAILGLGRVEKRPVVRGDDKIRVRKILPVTLCFDHRVADGAQAAAFVRDIKEMLENSLEFMSRI
ncbi:MAG: 2-oxo acid dehydrogenase subunit E2, partial [Desulfobacterales bacterium]|nr:2-oxo acid dehydrogenase subunit E2 [Desulfobacterales bacterium]